MVNKTRNIFIHRINLSKIRYYHVLMVKQVNYQRQGFEYFNDNTTLDDFL